VTPGNNYTVHVLNYTTKLFEDARASMLCDHENQTHVNCWIDVQEVVHGHAIGFIMIKKNASGEVFPAPRNNQSTIIIKNELQSL